MKKALVAIGLLVILLGLLYWQFPYALKGANSKSSLTYFAILAAAVVISISNSKIERNEIIRYAMMWLSLAIVLLLLYNYKNELLSVLVPNRPQILKDGSFIITASQDKHFHIEVTMNNKTLDCLVDTGATAIVIDINDAKSIGIATDQLNFNVPSETANGITFSARATVSYLRIGDIKLNDKPISINQSEMNHCLLGMSFLSTLKKISIEGDKMILSPQ